MSFWIPAFAGMTFLEVALIIKFEIRISNFETNPKLKFQNFLHLHPLPLGKKFRVKGFGHLYFGHLYGHLYSDHSCLFRISCFGFRYYSFQCFSQRFGPAVDLFLSVHLGHRDEEMMVELRIKSFQWDAT